MFYSKRAHHFSAKKNLIQLFERDYLNNLLIASPTEITELSNLPVWWICQENLNHRYKIQVKERMAYKKRKKSMFHLQRPQKKARTLCTVKKI